MKNLFNIKDKKFGVKMTPYAGEGIFRIYIVEWRNYNIDVMLLI